MKGKQRERETESAEINISPLIDMVFILLIFFIVTTVFVDESGLGIDTPTPVPPTIENDSEPVVLRVSEGGSVYYRNREIAKDAIASAIVNERNGGGSGSVIIEAHERTKVAAVSEILDICSALEVEKVVTKTARSATE
ncbi:biopolymer transporter ExbD [Pelagicoccus enzymogenes]|uniref:ExbD/TolR family protein n=1 Tax=Pelagicoccus enzymogenes TaxID=2773457 RepID=UPI00280EC1C5|nr:biopolymer transporter ExbD [Pelagicoccus enzymogenes]MDQ8199278.1 biopolymer transporter ExbD [Pelagicoccus enzymogenes]